MSSEVITTIVMGSITALTGLGGIMIGSWFVSRDQGANRVLHARDQLRDAYATWLAELEKASGCDDDVIQSLTNPVLAGGTPEEIDSAMRVKIRETSKACSLEANAFTFLTLMEPNQERIKRIDMARAIKPFAVAQESGTVSHERYLEEWEKQSRLVRKIVIEVNAELRVQI